MNNCRTKRASRTVSQELATKELMNARVLMIKAVQGDMTNEPEFESWVRDLSTYQHQDGFVRCGGRLRNAQLTLEQKQPILLPTRH